MTNRQNPTYFATLQDAKATLRRRSASLESKASARAYLASQGWAPKRLIEYESLPFMTQYDVKIERPGELQIFSIPALSTLDARLAIARIHPDWDIITINPTPHDATEKE